MDGQGYSSKRLDHLGIVAGICRRIGLIEQIDEIVGRTDRKVSVGQAVQAMVLNGLGFVSRPLYLAPEFLEGKPVEVLFDDEKLVAQDSNDDSLGRALDRLFEVGPTEIFAHVVSRALRELDIQVETVHLDSTSFSLAGDYHETQSSSDEKAIKITHGYSRDRRPDLKQAVLGMICAHRGAIPVWLSALDGNSSDSGSFPGMVEAYVAQFEAQGEERADRRGGRRALQRGDAPAHKGHKVGYARAGLHSRGENPLPNGAARTDAYDRARGGGLQDLAGGRGRLLW